MITEPPDELFLQSSKRRFSFTVQKWYDDTKDAEEAVCFVFLPGGPTMRYPRHPSRYRDFSLRTAVAKDLRTYSSAFSHRMQSFRVTFAQRLPCVVEKFETLWSNEFLQRPTPLKPSAFTES